MFKIRSKRAQDDLDPIETPTGGESPSAASTARSLLGITMVVSREFGVSVELIMSRNRTQVVADARYVSMTLASEVCQWLSQREIGAFFGRVGSDVAHARRNVCDRAEYDARFRAQLHGLRQRVKL